MAVTIQSWFVKTNSSLTNLHIFKFNFISSSRLKPFGLFTADFNNKRISGVSADVCVRRRLCSVVCLTSHRRIFSLFRLCFCCCSSQDVWISSSAFLYSFVPLQVERQTMFICFNCFSEVTGSEMWPKWRRDLMFHIKCKKYGSCFLTLMFSKSLCWLL